MIPTAYPLSGTRILVVEDEYYLADDLSRALADAGALVIGPFGTLDEAERKASEGGFDCAVLDMNLRGDFTYSVAQRLQDARVPFVIATGYDAASLPESLRSVPRIEKPFTTDELISALCGLTIPTRRRA